MKKMFGAGNDNDRQFLGSSPVQNGIERNHVVLITVNDEHIRDRSDVVFSAGMNERRDIQSFHGWRHHDQFLWPEPLRGICLDCSTKGKSSQYQWWRLIEGGSELSPDRFNHREHILDLAHPMVVPGVTITLALFHATEIEFDRDEPQFE